MQRYKYQNKRGNENMNKEHECLVNNNDLYQLQVGDMLVEIKYSNNKRIEEYILNILRQKNK